MVLSVTAITHYSNGLFQDWLQETDLAFENIKVTPI
jgi:hypothetical protein